MNTTPSLDITQAPAPSLALLHAAQDEMAEYAAMLPMRAPPVPADRDDVFSESDDDMSYMTLQLGDARVDVGYIVISHSVLAQGVALPEGWVDIDDFSSSVRKRWERNIERELDKARA